MDSEDNLGSTQRNSKIQTLTNVVKAAIGIGMLSLPYAFRQAGLVVGTVGCLLSGILTTYCMLQVVVAHNIVAKGRFLNYSEVAQEAFRLSKFPWVRKCSKVAGVITNVMIVITQLGLCTVFILYCSKTMKDLSDTYVPTWELKVAYWHIAITIVLIPYCFITSLHRLSYFMHLANAGTIVCVVIIFQYVIRNVQPLDNIDLVTTPADFFSFFGTAMFAFASTSSVLPVRNAMKTPKSFDGTIGVLSIGMAIVCLLYTSTGILGYLCFGRDSIVITRNLPDHW